jgi:hypothetical protein
MYLPRYAAVGILGALAVVAGLGGDRPQSDRVADVGASGGTTPGLTWTESMTSEVTMSGALDLVVIRPTPADDPS